MKDLHIDAASPGTGRETRLPPDTIIASSTDLRGIIRYANPQFCEIAELGLDGLVGAPHRIVRHRDMPKGLFYLFWDRLKRGLPVCGYVKNRTASGGFYWVFATVTTSPEGYLSVRIRPNAALFETIQTVYRDLLALEQSGLTPEQSARTLTEAIADLGFADYDAFMQAALAEECRLRASTGETGDCCLPKLADLGSLLASAEDRADTVGRDFVKVRSEPVNMRILAGRLEGASGALGTISQNYDIMAAEMQQLVQKLRCRDSGALGRMRTALDRGRFLAQVALLMKKAAEQPDFGGATQLADQSERLMIESTAALAEISAAARSIPDICRQLRHRINGLNVVKLLCRVESGRMQNADTGLNGIIERLERFHEETETNLAALSSKADQIKSNSMLI